MDSVKMVCGFAFDPALRRVLLIRKNRPAWQAGFLNGIGGKMEPGEYAIDAMVREFEEESGIKTGQDQWESFCMLDLEDDSYVKFFYAILSDASFMVKSMTDETIEVIKVQDIEIEKVIPNLKWLIPMAKWFITTNNPSEIYIVGKDSL